MKEYYPRQIIHPTPTTEYYYRIEGRPFELFTYKQLQQMGVKDEQYDKLHDISNTQLYKMAGNSIVVDVLMGIFKNLFLSDEGTSGQLTLF
jgi:site-specific DNA-cytosine methylase